MKEKRKWLWEFSKKIVVTVTIMFVAVFLFGCILLVIYPDSVAIQYIIENITDVFKVTVVSYAVKAGFENVFKIRKGGIDYGLDSIELGEPDDNSGFNSRRG